MIRLVYHGTTVETCLQGGDVIRWRPISGGGSGVVTLLKAPDKPLPVGIPNRALVSAKDQRGDGNFYCEGVTAEGFLAVAFLLASLAGLEVGEFSKGTDNTRSCKLTDLK